MNKYKKNKKGKFQCPSPPPPAWRQPTEKQQAAQNTPARTAAPTAITRDTAMKAIKKNKLKSKHLELHYPQENMIRHNLIIPTKLHSPLN